MLCATESSLTRSAKPDLNTRSYSDSISQPHEADLAEELWADRRTRESLMLAPMLYPAADMDSATAARWIRTAPTTEVADVLCLKLLRHIPEAIDLAIEAAGSDEVWLEMVRYTALRLMFNLLNTASSPAGLEAGFPSPKEIAHIMHPFVKAERQAASRLTQTLSIQLLDEIEFILE